MWVIQCIIPASNTDSVGVTKCVYSFRGFCVSKLRCCRIMPYTRFPTKAFSRITFKDPTKHDKVTPLAELLDALWISGYPLHPSWQDSFGQQCRTLAVNEITAFSFIKMDLSKCSTLYTALCYVRAQQCKDGRKDLLCIISSVVLYQSQ